MCALGVCVCVLDVCVCACVRGVQRFTQSGQWKPLKEDLVPRKEVGVGSLEEPQLR